MPYGGKKKGADGGVDGLIWFRPDGKAIEKAVVSVKGGDTVGVGMIRELGNVVSVTEQRSAYSSRWQSRPGPWRSRP